MSDQHIDSNHTEPNTNPSDIDEMDNYAEDILAASSITLMTDVMRALNRWFKMTKSLADC